MESRPSARGRPRRSPSNRIRASALAGSRPSARTWPAAAVPGAATAARAASRLGRIRRSRSLPRSAARRSRPGVTRGRRRSATTSRWIRTASCRSSGWAACTGGKGPVEVEIEAAERRRRPGQRQHGRAEVVGEAVEAGKRAAPQPAADLVRLFDQQHPQPRLGQRDRPTRPLGPDPTTTASNPSAPATGPLSTPRRDYCPRGATVVRCAAVV